MQNLTCENSLAILQWFTYNAGIMPDAFRYLSYYAKNYAGITGLGLLRDG